MKSVFQKVEHFSYEAKPYAFLILGMLAYALHSNALGALCTFVLIANSMLIIFCRLQHRAALAKARSSDYL